MFVVAAGTNGMRICICTCPPACMLCLPVWGGYTDPCVSTVPFGLSISYGWACLLFWAHQVLLALDMVCSWWKTLSCMCRPGAMSPHMSVALFLVTSARALWEHLLGYLDLDEECSLAPNYFPGDLFLFGSILFYCSWVRAHFAMFSAWNIVSHVSSLGFWMLLRASVGGSPSQGHCRAMSSVPPQHLVPRGAGGCLGPCLHLTNSTKPPLKKSSSGCKGKLRRKPIWIYQDEFVFHHFYKKL